MSKPDTKHNMEVDTSDDEVVDLGPRYFRTLPAACLKRRYRAVPQESLEKIRKRLVSGYKELEVPETSNDGKNGEGSQKAQPKKEPEKSKVETQLVEFNITM